ncbi:MAG: hypothetical protein ACE5NJ_06015, partial [Thermodesulfobacteriota bacterium]
MRMRSLKVIGLLLIMGVSFSHCSQYPRLQHGRTYIYQYTRRGVEIGTEVFSIEGEGDHFILKADIDIKVANSYQRGNSELVFRKNGSPVAYFRRLDVKLPEIPAQNGLWELRYAFHGKEVTGEVTKDGSTQWQGSVEMEKKEVYPIDNNALSLLSVLVKVIYPKLRREVIYSVRAFHFSEARVREVTFRRVKDGMYRCRIGRIDVGNLSIRDGVLLKHEDPAKGLVIRLKQ